MSDRGRMIDHVQNVNTHLYDKFASGKTSIRLFHPPGGEDHVKIGWDYNEPEEYNTKKKNQPKKNVYYQEPPPKQEYTKAYHFNNFVDDEINEEPKEEVVKKNVQNNKIQKEKNEDKNLKEHGYKKKKSFSNKEVCVVVTDKKNIEQQNTLKVIKEINDVSDEIQKDAKNAHQQTKDDDDITKGGKVMVFNFCK